MSDLQEFLNVSEIIAKAVCGVYFTFGFLVCIAFNMLIDWVWSRWKNKDKEEKK